MNPCSTFSCVAHSLTPHSYRVSQVPDNPLFPKLLDPPLLVPSWVREKGSTVGRYRVPLHADVQSCALTCACNNCHQMYTVKWNEMVHVGDMTVCCMSCMRIYSFQVMIYPYCGTEVFDGTGTVSLSTTSQLAL